MSLDSLAFNHKRVAARTVDELIGISKGLIADGKVCESEALFLANWLQENACFAKEHPTIQIIYDKIAEIFEDGILEEHELHNIFDLLKALSGGIHLKHEEEPELVEESTEKEESLLLVSEDIHSFSSTLPLTRPCPVIDFESSVFCFTGKFALGTRKDCCKVTIDRGATVIDSITRKLTYLVVGIEGSCDWKHSTMGSKIVKVMELQKKGLPVFIISEEDWINAILNK